MHRRASTPGTPRRSLLIVGALAAVLAVIPAPAEAASVSIKDATVTEGDSGTTLKFKVTRTHSRKAVSVHWETLGDSAEPFTDFFGGSGKLKIAPNRRAKKIPIDIVGDTFDEPNETFAVVISRPRHAKIKDDQATGTIIDDDPPLGCFDQALAAHVDSNTDNLESGCATSPFDALPSCAADPGTHQWWAFEIPVGAVASFSATPAAPDDIGVALFTANDTGSELDCDDALGNGGKEVVSTTNNGASPLTVYTQVFAAALGNEGPYELRIQTGSPCFSAAVAMGPGSNPGNLANGCPDGTGDAEAACAHTGAHEWWSYTIPASSGVIFTASPTMEDDIGIAAFTENSASAQIECADMSLSGPETLQVNNANASPLTVYVQVFAYDTVDEGQYTIEFAAAP